MRGIFGLNRPDHSEELEGIIKTLEEHEAEREALLIKATQSDYTHWANRFELLKREFNTAWDFFEDLEDRITGWYCVSPSLAPWKSVHCARDGYTFSACIMKNHHRDAPLSEKSLTISFGLQELPAGIGDERWVGRTGEISDSLIGLPACTGKSLREQHEGARHLKERILARDIYFRLNHTSFGQQCTRLPLSILEKHSLKDLCQRLFVLLNNDVLLELQNKLANPETLLLPDDTAEQYQRIVNQ